MNVWNLWKCLENLQGRGALRPGENAPTVFNFIVSFMKGMSKDTRFDSLDEHEWRIVQCEKDKKERFAVKENSEGHPVVPLKPEDVKLIVFPDEETKKRVVESKRF